MNAFSKPVLLIAAIVSTLAAGVNIARAGDVKVIANSSINLETISAHELKSIFLEEKSSVAGTHVEPVLQRGGPAHEAFLKQFLRMSDDELQTYFRSLVFTGKSSMPRILSSDEEVVAYVAKTDGAIGYVSAGASADGVKTLATGEAASAERKLISRVEPAYPEELQKRAIGGTVRLRITIAPAGNVEHAELLGGNPVLGDAAIAAVQKWKYSPAAARSTAEISVPFDPVRP
jgi:TonB family protein